MMQTVLSPPARPPCDPRTPGASLWCGDDAVLDCDYLEPRDLDEAVAALRAAGGRARLVAGGQSLLPALRSGMLRADRLVSLRRIASLQDLRVAQGQLCIGAQLSFSDFLASAHAAGHPLLQQALAKVGNHTVRNRTTFGGSIAWANPMGALLLALAMLDATVRTSARRLPSTACVAGVHRNQLADDEIIAGVEIALPPAHRRFAFHKTTARRSGGKALSSMAVALDTGTDGRQALRIGVVGLQDRAWVSHWHACAPHSDPADAVPALLAAAPQGPRFDPLLPSPAYARASAALVCRRLVQELCHA
jgi:carbon-monoxide dehydrogenase medium subunit